MDSLKKIKLTAGLSATLLLGGGAAVRDVTVLDVAPIERVEIIAGERVEAKQIDNVVEATFPWKDQPGIKVKYDMGEPTLEEKAKDVRKKQVITETVTDFEGGFKVDIILSERPDTNRFCYTIEGAENYDFFYQPPLTEEEIAEGASRPPEIEGSYAVYHKTLKDHIEGQTNYATGKVMHIPRPQVWSLSDEGNKQWADLSYENGQLCVTASQEFLENATYPVRIDPTFGYTTIGGTGQIWGTSSYVLRGRVGTPAESGTITAVTFYGENDNTADFFVGGVIYSADASMALLGEGTDANVNSTTAQWWNVTFSSGPSVTASVNYYATFLQRAFDEAAGDEIGWYSDSGGTSGHSRGQNYTAGTFPDPWATYTNSTLIYSVYATYTAAAEEETPVTPYTTIKGDVQMSGDVYFAP